MLRSSISNAAIDGARNLLTNCARLRADERLLILHEDPALGWYDADAPALVAQVARTLGVQVELRQVDGPDNRLLDARFDSDGGTDADTGTDAGTGMRIPVTDDYDCCIFFARIGDQLRFEDAHERGRRVMCYATSLGALASHYGRVPHQAMVDLKETIDNLLVDAAVITITCPLGSDLRGSVNSGANGEKAASALPEVKVQRFPLGVHLPIAASGFSGVVKLSRYLTPTGSRVYHPPWVAIGAPVAAQVEKGRISGYTGDADNVRRIEDQYRRVARAFSLNPDVVHSWHAGIHQGCYFKGSAADDPDRWSNSVFTNPRFVHFHTCGEVAPGEICWMVLDPTICVDGKPLWADGRLQLAEFLKTRQCVQRWPILGELAASANGDIGLP